jgi:hypothetical protein
MKLRHSAHFFGSEKGRERQRGDGLRRNRMCKGQGGRHGEIKMAALWSSKTFTHFFDFMFE